MSDIKGNMPKNDVSKTKENRLNDKDSEKVNGGTFDLDEVIRRVTEIIDNNEKNK